MSNDSKPWQKTRSNMRKWILGAIITIATVITFLTLFLGYYNPGIVIILTLFLVDLLLLLIYNILYKIPSEQLGSTSARRNSADGFLATAAFRRTILLIGTLLTAGVILSITFRTPFPLLFFWMFPLGLWALSVSEPNFYSYFYLLGTGWLSYIVIGWLFVRARHRRITLALYLVFLFLVIVNAAGCMRYVSQNPNW